MSRKTLIGMLKNSANVKNEISELGIEYILSLQYEYEQGSLLKSKKGSNLVKVDTFQERIIYLQWNFDFL